MKYMPEEEYFEHVMLAAGVSEHIIAQLNRNVVHDHRHSNVSHYERIKLSPQEYLDLIMKRAGFAEEEIKAVAKYVKF